MADLTPKQRQFIKHISDGKTHAESYRLAYNTSGKAATARREAARLLANPVIATSLEQLIEKKQRLHIAREISDRERTLSALRRCLDGEIELRSDQVAAANMLAKASGLFVLQVSDVTDRSSEDIADDLKRKLSQLALSDIDNNESDVTH